MPAEFRLGDWLVRPELNLLEQGESTVRVEPKVMNLPVYLAENAGEVLPKERIIGAVWADVFVGDESLTYAISELRKALSDDARNPRFIQTIPPRGYRLIAPVSFRKKNRHQFINTFQRRAP
ncbi:MAG: transcriptional regulator [Acidobacteriota bacterium]